MIIYKIINKINGMIYIGQTTRRLKERILEHVRHKETYIDKAMNKYGLDKFDIKTIDKAETIEELNQKEIYWIKYYNCIRPNGYNLCEGGGVTIGFKHSEESKKKMSETHRLRGNQKGEKNHFYGKHHSEEQKAKWKETRHLARHTKEVKEKMRHNRKDSRKVLNITTGKEFESISLAAEYYNLKDTHISRVCRGGRKRTGGYEWKYIDEII